MVVIGIHGHTITIIKYTIIVIIIEMEILKVTEHIKIGGIPITIIGITDHITTKTMQIIGIIMEIIIIVGWKRMGRRVLKARLNDIYFNDYFLKHLYKNYHFVVDKKFA